MSQPPVSGRGPGADLGRGDGMPGGDGGRPGGGAPQGRDPRLAGFAQPGDGEAPSPPGAALGVLLDELSGSDRRCPGATDDELIGLLSRWAALDSWVTAAKLGVVRELIRRRARPGLLGGMHGDLPDAWDEGLGHELAAELGMSVPGADKLAMLAWELQARLPGTGAKLADGTIDYVKAKIIAEELAVLDDALAARAEDLIADNLAGKTPGQIGKLAAAAVCEVDPDGAAKRREQAERDDARVRFWRERTGASALAGFGLPTDAALAANANIDARAQEYKQGKIAPDAKTDQLRVLAYLDMLNGVSAADRIAQAHADAAAEAGPDHGPGPCHPGDPGASGASGTGPGGSEPGSTDGGDGGPPETGPAETGPAAGDGGPADGGPAGRGPAGGGTGPVLPARLNLTIPFATLLDLADRPGEAHSLGPLDPALARDLAAAAARSPNSDWCVTVTNAAGWAIGHGCARPARTRETTSPPGNRDGPRTWNLTPTGSTSPPDGYGSWTITLPGGRDLTVRLGPVPLTDCDHRHETHGYQPGDTLRHLVQIRDGECTFPPCSRHARDSDFEHATPYHHGGKTCTCNAGARSRKCHRVKQSPGWNLTQPQPGWHEWTTPSGRTYTQGPKQYPI